jgi:hypothetical protein
MNKEFNKAKKQASKAISAVVKPIYFESIPVAQLSAAMEANGFDAQNFDGIYTGRQGNTSIACSFIADPNKAVYVSLSWYRMPSGRIEIVAYVS